MSKYSEEFTDRVIKLVAQKLLENPHIAWYDHLRLVLDEETEKLIMDVI